MTFNRKDVHDGSLVSGEERLGLARRGRRRIETRASRNAYVALSIGGFALVVHLLGGAMLGVPPRYRDLATPFATANLVLVAMVAAELVKYVSQLVYYRRGI